LRSLSIEGRRGPRALWQGDHPTSSFDRPNHGAPGVVTAATLVAGSQTSYRLDVGGDGRVPIVV
jgi:hypothetical protein